MSDVANEIQHAINTIQSVNRLFESPEMSLKFVKDNFTLNVKECSVRIVFKETVSVVSIKRQYGLTYRNINNDQLIKWISENV